MSETQSRSPSLLRLPRFRLRTLLLAVVLVAVFLRLGQWAWPKYLLYQQGQEYVALQATKQQFVDDQRKQFDEDKKKNPSAESLAVDDARPIPSDFVILLRSRNNFGCLIPRSQSMNPETLKYDWYYRTDGQGRLAPGIPNVQSGHGSFSPSTRGGGDDKVKFGPFEIDWSGNGPDWGYLYYASRTIKRLPGQSSRRSEPGKANEYELAGHDHLRICTTNVKSVEFLDARDPQWIYLAFPGDEGIPGNVDIDPPAVAR